MPEVAPDQAAAHQRVRVANPGAIRRESERDEQPVLCGHGPRDVESPRSQVHVTAQRTAQHRWVTGLGVVDQPFRTNQPGHNDGHTGR